MIKITVISSTKPPETSGSTELWLNNNITAPVFRPLPVSQNTADGKPPLIQNKQLPRLPRLLSLWSGHVLGPRTRPADDDGPILLSDESGFCCFYYILSSGTAENHLFSDLQSFPVALIPFVTIYIHTATHYKIVGIRDSQYE